MIQRNGDERAERRFRIALFGVLLLVLVGVHFVDPSFYPTIYQLSMDGDLKGTIAYLKTFGVYAAFMSFFIDVVINVVGFLPSIFISTANGLIFGLFWGTIISWLAETVGVIISFYMMRTLFRRMAKHVIAQSKTLTKLEKKGIIARELRPGHRGKFIRLTDKGQKICEKISEVVARHRQQALAALPVSGRRQLELMMRQLQLDLSSGAGKS